jgi:hypothetical protein
MAKIIRTYNLCDVCLSAGEEVEGQPISEDLPDLPKDGELCKQHRVEIIEPLLAFLAEHGRKPESQMILCGRKGCSRDFKSKAARAQHIRQAHPGASIK